MRKLTIQIEGATAQELARGLAAAQGWLDGHGVTAEDAAIGHHLREAWNIGGRQIADSPSEAEFMAAGWWDDAAVAAAVACCAGWPHPLRTVTLGLKDHPQPLAQD